MDTDIDVDQLLQTNGQDFDKTNKEDSRLSKGRKTSKAGTRSPTRSKSDSDDDAGKRRNGSTKHRERSATDRHRRDRHNKQEDKSDGEDNAKSARKVSRDKDNDNDNSYRHSKSRHEKYTKDYADDDSRGRKKDSHRRRSPEADGADEDTTRKAGHSSHRHRKRRHRSSRSDDEVESTEKDVRPRRAPRGDDVADDMDIAEDEEDMVATAAIAAKSAGDTRHAESLSSSSRRAKNYDDGGLNGKSSKITGDAVTDESSRKPEAREASSSARSRREEDTSSKHGDVVSNSIDAYGRPVTGGGGSAYGKDKYADAGERRRRRDGDDDDDDRSLLTAVSYDSRGRIIRDPSERTNSYASRRNDEAKVADAANIVTGGTARRHLGRNIMETDMERRRYEHYGNERTPERWDRRENRRDDSAAASSRNDSSRRRDDDGQRDRGGRDDNRDEGDKSSRRKSRSPRSGRTKQHTPVASPVLNEEERDQRTVFVMQLSQRVTAWDLEEFFSAVGEIRDVRLIVDGRTKRSKGIAYIEFRDIESVPLAIGLNAQKLRGVPIKVQASHAERNRAAEAAAALLSAATSGSDLSAFPPPPISISASTAAAIAEANGPPGPGMQFGNGRPYIPRHLRKQQAVEAAAKAAMAVKDGGDKPMRVYVGSLHFSITEDDLRAIFEPFGPLNVVSLVREPQTGRSRGYAFLTYKREEDARASMAQMNGFDLAGRQIKVSHVNEKGPESGESHGGQTERLEVEDGRGGFSMTGTSRLALMAKLAEGTGLEIPDHLKATLDLQKKTQDQQSAAYQLMQQQKLLAQQEANRAQQEAHLRAHTQPNDAPEYATQCVLLSSMFDPTQESGEEWHEEIRDDVIGECLKHGGCVHVYVDRDSKEGNVYAKCPSVAIAVATVKAMNGRHYGGRVLQANYVPVAHYNELFADSVRATTRLQPRDAA